MCLLLFVCFINLFASKGESERAAMTTTSEKDYPSAEDLLTHLLRTAERQNKDIIRTVVFGLWTSFKSIWAGDMLQFRSSESWALATPLSLACFRRATASVLLLSEVCARYQVLDILEECDNSVFIEWLPAVVGALEQPHDSMWDEMCAALLPVCVALASVDATICDTPRCNAVRWMVSVFSQSGTSSPIFQNVVLLLAIGMNVDGLVASFTDALRSAVHGLFLQCCNLLSDSVLVTLLLRAIPRGTIRGDLLYATDLDVLLFILRRMKEQKIVADLTIVEACECQVLRDVAPTESASTNDVERWVQRLGLSGDYTTVVRRQGVDGAVLWSGLTMDDVREIGIYDLKDAEKFLATLHSNR